MSRQDELLALLLEVRDTYGELTPAILVQAARPKDHPLHNELEWNNTKAGEAWRLEQAHRLITSIRVKFRDATDAERDVRALVAVARPGVAQPDYQPVHEVVGDDFRRRMLLQDMERQWRTLRARYNGMQEFAELVLRDLRGEVG